MLRFNSIVVVLLALSWLGCVAYADEYATVLPSKQKKVYSVKLVINDRILDAEGTIVNGVTMVPLRPVVETMNGVVQAFKNSSKISVVTPRHEATLQVGKREVIMDGRKIVMSIAATIIDGKLCIPLRFFVDECGARLDWSNYPRIAYLYSGDFRYKYSATNSEQVRAVFVSPIHPVVTGDTINFEVFAAPASTVFIDVAGVKTGIPAYEERPSRYLASLVIDKEMQAYNAKITARVENSGKNYTLDSRHRATINPVSAINRLGSVAIYPESNGIVHVKRPVVAVEAVNTTFKFDTIRLWFDEVEYTHQAIIHTDTVSWRPSYDVNYGKHHIRFEADDVNGRKHVASWYFSVLPPNNRISSSEDHPEILMRVRAPRENDSVNAVFSVIGRTTASADVTITVEEYVGKELGIIADVNKPMTQHVQADVTGRFEAEFDTSEILGGHPLIIRIQAERDGYTSPEAVLKVVRK